MQEEGRGLGGRHGTGPGTEGSGPGSAWVGLCCEGSRAHEALAHHCAPLVIVLPHHQGRQGVSAAGRLNARRGHGQQGRCACFPRWGEGGSPFRSPPSPNGRHSLHRDTPESSCLLCLGLGGCRVLAV